MWQAGNLVNKNAECLRNIGMQPVLCFQIQISSVFRIPAEYPGKSVTGSSLFFLVFPVPNVQNNVHTIVDKSDLSQEKIRNTGYR